MMATFPEEPRAAHQSLDPAQVDFRPSRAHLHKARKIGILGGRRELADGTGAHFDATDPQVIIRQPILSSAEGYFQLSLLVQLNWITKEPPSAIDDLYPGLDGEGLAIRAWDPVLDCCDVSRMLPTPLALHFHPLLAVNHAVVDDPADLSLVDPCKGLYEG